MKKDNRLFSSPQAMLVGGFASVILLGAFVLWLPFSHHPGQVNFLDALFTSTSAVCVTGLVVVDTGKAYTHFGQVVIMLLIQAGGLGVMTFAALTFQILRSRMSLQTTAVLHDSFFQRDIGHEFKRLFWRILGMTFSIELVGAGLLSFVLIREKGLAAGLFSALFHSVSAFCNAGFSLYSDSLIGLRTHPIVTFTIMGLIVLGGLGYSVLLEFWDRFRRFREDRNSGALRLLSLNTRVVLYTTAFLIVGGAASLLLLGLTPGEHGWGTRISAALFQSVTARTAGFNTIHIGRLPVASLILLILLMFVGGSPGSCAGGIKTTSFAVYAARIRSRLLGEQDVHILGRRIPREILRRTTLLISLSIVWNGAGVILLMAMEAHHPGMGLPQIMFEQISAFGTVGLSTGITSSLSAGARLWIIATMFMGRLGPLTLAMLIFKQKRTLVRYPVGRVMIG
ncbi:MAG: potassium transporter TrkG [Acidobacteriota bacterium]|jgi:trk system potassium uptake protein